MKRGPGFPQPVRFTLYFPHRPTNVRIGQARCPHQRRRLAIQTKINLRFAASADRVDMSRFMIIGEDHESQSASSMDSRHKTT